MYIEILAACITLLFVIILYFKRAFNYWESRNIPYIQPTIPWGNVGNPLRAKKIFPVLLKDFYDELKSKGNSFGGLYLMSQPGLLMVHPSQVRQVLSKDFQYFTGHGTHADESDPFTGNLFFLDGEKWRNMRVKLTPTFTSGKMKMMFPLIVKCGGPMINYIDTLNEQGKAVEMKDTLACFSTDIIGSCAFGVECNSFKKTDAEFRKYGKQIFESGWRRNLYRILNIINPKLNLNVATTETRDFFINTFTQIVNYRERNGSKRNDFVQLLLDMNEKAKSNGSGDVLRIDQMVAQSLLFFAAGFETSSTTMTFCLHELSHNLDMQEKLRKEVNEIMSKYDGQLTYQGIMEMKYLDMLLEETLRKYPPAPALTRECTKEYTIQETGTVINAGMKIFISIFGLHRDPDYFPNPNKFDPERFSDKNKANIRPFTYIPFGEGPRICIGLRFGLMQAKVGLCLLMKNYIISPHESTMDYIREFHSSSQVLSFKDDLLLKLQKIT